MERGTNKKATYLKHSKKHSRFIAVKIGKFLIYWHGRVEWRISFEIVLWIATSPTHSN